MKSKLKYIFIAIIALVIFSSNAFAGLRFPVLPESNYVADEANVFSSNLISQINLFNKEASLPIYLASVRFTDGATIEDYTKKLFKFWNLGDNDYLIVLSVGDESFYAFGGENASKTLSTRNINSLFVSSGFTDEFSKESYNTAVAMLFNSINKTIAKKGSNPSDSSVFENSNYSQSFTNSSSKSNYNFNFDKVKKDFENQKSTSVKYSKGSALVYIIFAYFVFRYLKNRSKKGCGCISIFLFIMLILGMLNLYN